MRAVQVYVNDVRLDLFQDESIVVTSTIQNVKDISKVFTDFSQSFTVPASKVNNSVFSHYYNNDINGTFIAKERANARIEINHTPFRVGKMQLEGAEIKDNKPESYKITFYGDVVTLKDKFGEDKLSDLDYSGLVEEYRGDFIKDKLSSTLDYDVRYPLITSDRIWRYGDASSNDISIVGGAIDYKELYPAVRVSRIIDYIKNKYDLTFTGNFLSDKRFTNMFTLWKNNKVPDFYLKPTPITFNDTTNDIFNDNLVKVEKWTDSDIDPTNIGYSYINTGTFQINFYHYCFQMGAEYSIDIYRTINSVKTLVGSHNYIVTSTGPQQNIQINDNNPTVDNFYSFELRSVSTVEIDEVGIGFTKTYSYVVFSPNFPVVITTGAGITSPEVNNPFVVTPYFNFKTSAPDIKIADYFSGLLSEFNLTCFPLQDNKTFHIEPLDVWYKHGGEVNITPYTIIDSIKVDRPKLHKVISFEWQESKSFLNEQFKATFNRGYGDLKDEFDFDGSEFKVKLPFENLYFNRFPSTDLQVGYSTTKAEDGNGYLPKVTNLYLGESTPCSFWFDDGTTTTEITSYLPLGQDLSYNGFDYSSNFGSETSTLKNQTINKSLFKVYYEPYLVNLFDNKTRQVTVECILPLRMLTFLTLDDAVILRDKKYRINEMKTDLTTGKVTLVLLSDWIKNRFVGDISFDPKPFDDVDDLVAPIKPIKPPSPSKPYDGGGGYVVAGLPTTTSFISTVPALPATFTTESSLIITPTVNGTTSDRSNAIPLTYYDAQGNIMQVDYLVITQEAEKFYLLKEDGDYLLTEFGDKIKI